ncbi:MAG: S1 RNA-binding domain-containing protein [Candidatus Moranbacteria bacterium]|nr:S1 RNA-binding domain-containing protein [Candidatus Moranbacteria bacterium]
MRSIQDMDKLINEAPVNIPKVGDLVSGVVVAVTNSAIYVDLGVLGTGIIMGREMKDGLGVVEKLKEGDGIEATVVEIENEDGYMELSVREAAYEKTWSELERKMIEGETVSTRILEANRGGLMVEINGIYGFLPVSQLSHEHYPRVEDGDKNKILQLLLKLVGLEVSVKIIDVDVKEEKLIVSEKATYEEKEKAVIGEFQVGDIIDGVVSGVVDFGAFVKFAPKRKKIEETSEKEMLEGLVHISELAWQLIENPQSVVKTGEKVRCKIIDIDGTRVSLSIRALIDDPWSKIGDKYKNGDIVWGEVTKINPFGAFVQLDKDIHGLAHVSEILSNAKAKSLADILEVNKKYRWKILSIEPESHRLGLALAWEDKKGEKEKEEASAQSTVFPAGEKEKKEKGRDKKKKAGKSDGKNGKEKDADVENKKTALEKPVLKKEKISASHAKNGKAQKQPEKKSTKQAK